MDNSSLVPILIGITVIVVIGGLGMAMSRNSPSLAEDRLAGLMGLRRARRDKKQELASGILARPAAIDLGRPSFLTRLVPNAENLNLLYEQADVSFSFKTLLYVSGGFALAGLVFGLAFRLPLLALPVVALFPGSLPFFWLIRRRRNRIRLFVSAMPEAVELISRALRSGHGLASGLQLVAEEMKGPVADEFHRVFFVIAVIIQRSTGGDLAEVLDKIGRLIRQRFELQGLVRSLTAEGRLSGTVLLGLTPSLLAFLCVLNYEYVSDLFTKPTGVKLLTGTAVGQLIGAWVIKKIVAIKV
jgi:tight adherence protein B